MYLHIQGLSDRATDRDIWHFFSQAHLARGIREIELIRGDAFVTFLDEDYLCHAVELDGLPLLDEPVRLSQVSQSERESVTGERLNPNSSHFHSHDFSQEEMPYSERPSATHQYDQARDKNTNTPPWLKDKRPETPPWLKNQDRSNIDAKAQPQLGRPDSGQSGEASKGTTLRFAEVSQGDRDFRYETSVNESISGRNKGDATLGDVNYSGEEISMNTSLGDRDFRYNILPEEKRLDEHGGDIFGDNYMSLGNKDFSIQEISGRDSAENVNTSLGDRDFRCVNPVGLNTVDVQKRELLGDRVTSEDTYFKDEEILLSDVDRNPNRVDIDFRSEAVPGENINICLGDRDFRLATKEDSLASNMHKSRSSSREAQSERRDSRDEVQQGVIAENLYYWKTASYGSRKANEPAMQQLGEHNVPYSVPGYVAIYNVRNSVTAEDLKGLFPGYAISNGGIIMKNCGFDLTAYVKFDNINDAVRANNLKSGIIHGQHIKIDRITETQFIHLSGGCTTVSYLASVPESPDAFLSASKIPTCYVDNQDSSAQNTPSKKGQDVSIRSIMFTREYPYTSVFSAGEDDKDQCYLGLWNLSSSITACGVWAWYGGSAGRTLGVTLGRVPECHATAEKMTMAFVVFRNPRDRFQAKSTYRFCTEYTADEVHKFLVSLDHTSQIYISTKLRADRMLTLDERSRITPIKYSFPGVELPHAHLDPENPPSYLIPWIENTHYIDLGKFDKTTPACKLSSIFSKNAGTNCKGTMVILTRNHKSRGFAVFPSYEFAKFESTVYMSSHVGRYMDKVIQQLPRENEIFISTKSGEDRLLTDAEKDLLISNCIGIRKVEQTMENEQMSFQRGLIHRSLTQRCRSAALVEVKVTDDSPSEYSSSMTSTAVKPQETANTCVAHQKNNNVTNSPARYLHEQNISQQNNSNNSRTQVVTAARVQLGVGTQPQQPSTGIALEIEKMDVQVQSKCNAMAPDRLQNKKESTTKAKSEIDTRKYEPTVETKRPSTAMMNPVPTSELTRTATTSHEPYVSTALDDLERPRPIQQVQKGTFKKIKLNLKR